MGAGDLELLDVVYVEVDDDGARIKVGDLSTSKGTGSDCAFLCNVGFVAVPNGPDASGGTEQILSWTPGNDRLVIAAIDTRYDQKAGTLAKGDRAIVSNCDAALRLTQATNQIQLLALKQGISITLDAANSKIQLTAADFSITLDALADAITIGSATAEILMSATQIFAQWAAGAVTNQLLMNASGTLLACFGPGGTSSVQLSPTGAMALVAPAGATLNGTPIP